MNYRTRLLSIVAATAVVLLSGCSTTVVDRNPSATLTESANTLVVPFTNDSGTPDAGKRAATMVTAMLRARGITNVTLYKTKQSCNPLKTCKKRLNMSSIRRWAAKNNYQYLVSGAVNEWRYKVGLDGEPSVGSTMVITDILSNQPIWTGLGSRTGHSWSGLSDTAQRLFKRMLSNIYVEA